MLASVNPRTGQRVADVPASTLADVARAAARAGAVAAAWADAPIPLRAALLRAIVAELEARRASIVRIADEETGLGEARFNGELDRTTGQLRKFAALIEEGSYVEAILTPADPASVPPQPDLRRMLIPLGPVGVFTPSNFPLAYGEAGGDTTAALAAGCPVVVKGHPSHPRTAALAAEACLAAVATVGAPDGVFALVQGADPDISRALVEAPEIKAVGFTGSQAVGRLLYNMAAARPEPIPFYGELGSVNPIFVSPAAAEARCDTIAEGFVASMNIGVGQFCTKPGLLFLPTGAAGDRLLEAIVERLQRMGASILLNEGLQKTLASKVARTASVAGVREAFAACPLPAEGFAASPRLFVVDVDHFFAEPALSEEHFGPVSIAVRCDAARMAEAASRLAGQLTSSLHVEPGDDAWAQPMVRVLIDKAGRVIWNGYPTSVTVVPAMTHGGPYPASTSSLHTSVGATSIRRFLRPVTYQAVPDPLLPPALKEGNPLGILRRVDGEWKRS